jgi:hypothetical protein
MVAIVADSRRCHLMTVNEALQVARIRVKEKGVLRDPDSHKFLLGVHRICPFKTQLFFVLTV